MRTMIEEDIPTLDGIIYLTCEFCYHWKDGEGPCSRGFRPTRYCIDGGSNEEMHFRLGCLTKALKPKYWMKASDISTEVTFSLDPAQYV